MQKRFQMLKACFIEQRRLFLEVIQCIGVGWKQCREMPLGEVDGFQA